MSDFLEGFDPRTFNELDLDSRISYDLSEDIYKFKDPETGDELQFNPILEKWIPSDLTNDENLTDAQVEIQQKKKLKLQELKQEKLKSIKKPSSTQTSIYVSNLPLNIDLAELNKVFSKYGVISIDVFTNKPRIKLYKDEKGNFKGDALVVYLKPESVDLAIQLLDDTKLSSNDSQTIKVERAKFKEDSNSSKTGGKRELDDDERKLIKKKLKLLNDKTKDWNGDDDTINPKWLRTVILKRAFTLQELREDPHAKDEIVEDITEGAQELGFVEKVILFDEEEEGVVMIRFANGDAAVKCIEKMDGRFFGGQKLIASRYNGEHYSKSEKKPPLKTKANDDGLSEFDNENERLQEYIETVDNES